jgi:hypothetical protein
VVAISGHLRLDFLHDLSLEEELVELRRHHSTTVTPAQAMATVHAYSMACSAELVPSEEVGLRLPLLGVIDRTRILRVYIISCFSTIER